MGKLRDWMRTGVDPAIAIENQRLATKLVDAAASGDGREILRLREFLMTIVPVIPAHALVRLGRAFLEIRQYDLKQEAESS